MAEGKRQPSPPEQQQHSPSPPDQHQHLVHLRDIDASEQSKKQEDKKSTEDIEQEDMSKSEGKEDTSLLSARIPGVAIIAEKSIQVNNDEQNIIWDGYGLRVRIPRGSMPKGRSHCQLKIGVAVSGEFQLPENGIPTSAVYWLSHDLQEELQNPITLEIQHCATNSALNGLCVVRASTLSHNLPYKFEQLQGAVFTPNTGYGAIELRNFCLLTTCWSRAWRILRSYFSPPIEYCAILYYTNIRHLGFQLQVYILQNLNANFMAIKANLEQPYKEGPGSKVEFESNEIKLDIPDDGVKIGDVWEIKPTNTLTVCKEDINSFSSRRRLFPCQMSVRWIGVEGRNTTPLIYKILMKGATDKHNFLTITSDLPLGIESGVQQLSLQTTATAAVPDIFDKVPSMEMFILIKFVNKESNKGEFRTIQNVGTKWRYVAARLGIDSAKIDNIAANRDPEAAASAMLQHWLGVDTSASWKKLCKAMGDANLKADANTLEYALTHMITNE